MAMKGGFGHLFRGLRSAIRQRERFSVTLCRILGHSAVMLLLSRVIGGDVLGADGTTIGRLVDFAATADGNGDTPAISRVLIRRQHGRDLLVPWHAVTSVLPRLSVSADASEFEVDSASESLDLNEILLAQDVLDTQIVDIAGQRLTRVADVVLAHRADGRVELIGVEVGFGAVLRRLGLGPLASRAHNDAVAWQDLHLTSERGHAVQLATPRAAVHLLSARDLAMLIARLDPDSAGEVLAARGPDVAADVIQVSHPAVSERVLLAMPEAEAADVVRVMPAHHAAHWGNVLTGSRIRRGRRYLRSHVWPRRRHEPQGAPR